MELSLHGTGYFVRNKTKKKILNPGTEHILVLGESSSYGLMLPNRMTQSYPVLIQSSLEEKFNQKKFKVVNLSYPGQTSFSILDNLELNLLKYKPKFAILHFGLNDYNPALKPISHNSYITKVKLLKLIYLSYVYFTFQDKILEGENGEYLFQDPKLGSKFSNNEYLKNTYPNFIEISKLLKKYSVPAVMLNYYKSPKVVNDLLLKVSKEQGLSLINLENESNLKEKLSKDDWHPSKLGHKAIAGKLIDYILKEKIFL